MACATEIEIPVLSEELILSVVKNVAKINFTANDLKVPTSEIMYSVYSGFICGILNISNEQITQVPMHVMETIAHPELCTEEAAGNLLFVKALQYLFNSCFIHNFTLNDLVAPTRKRTRKLLSALVNYIQFRNEHEQLKVDVETKVHTLRTGQSALLTKRQSLTERITQIKATRIEKQRGVQEMNLSALRAKQQEQHELKERKQSEDAAIKSQIEEFRNVLTVKKASKLIQQANDTVQDHISRGKSLSIKEKMYDELGSMAPSVLNRAKSVMQDTRKLESLIKEQEIFQDKIEEKRKFLKDITSETHNMQRIIATKHEKKERANINHAKKMKTLEEQQSKFEQEKALILRDIEEKKQKSQEVEEHLKNITESVFLREKEHKQSMKTMEEEYATLSSVFDTWQDDVAVNLHQISLKLQTLEPACILTLL